MRVFFWSSYFAETKINLTLSIQLTIETDSGPWKVVKVINHLELARPLNSDAYHEWSKKAFIHFLHDIDYLGTLDRIVIHPGRTMKIIATILGPIKKYVGKYSTIFTSCRLDFCESRYIETCMFPPFYALCSYLS